MRAVILGGGESGYGSATLARKEGMDVFLSDSGKIAEPYAEKLRRAGIPFEEGGHTENLILNAGLVVKSPGIPETAPIMAKIRTAGIPVVSEIEFAGRYTKGKTICITGSNGKTTTTTLIFEILRRAGYDVAVGGNIGRSFAHTVAVADKEWYVLELSSFQLDDMFDFRADVALLMNITPDHLDRYDYRIENYVDSKFRIIRNQRLCDYFVYCEDDQTVTAEIAVRKPQSRLLPFSRAGALRPGAYLSPEGTAHATVGERTLAIDTGRMKIKGLHNAYNAMAAMLAAMAAGVEDKFITDTLYWFGGVEHRMEDAGEYGGVQYINDSKATNVDSAWYALQSMTRPTIWIAGGTDKGNDYGPLRELAAAKVKALVCMGVDNGKLVESFSEVVPKIYDTHSLDEAMEACQREAVSGDAVLLSPACASFDLFRNYEDRGRQFKEWIKRNIV